MARPRRRGLKKKAELLAAPTRLSASSAELAAKPRGDGLSAKLAAFGARSLVRFAHWRGRRDAIAELKGGPNPEFRAVIQVNVIRQG